MSTQNNTTNTNTIQRKPVPVSMAPQFEETHYDMADFHEQQMDHYRRKNRTDQQRSKQAEKPLPPTPGNTGERPAPRRQRTTEEVLASSHGYAYQSTSTGASRRDSAGIEMATKHIGKLELGQRSESPRTSSERPRVYSPATASPVGRYQAPDVVDRKSTRLNSSHSGESRMPSSA